MGALGATANRLLRPLAHPAPARKVVVSTGVNEAREAQFATAARQASGSSFYAGMRVLPKAQRDAMYEIYAFCRAVDDVADEGGTRPERLAGLARWRDAIEAAYAGRTTGREPPACSTRSAASSSRASISRHHRRHGDGWTRRHPCAG